MSQIIKDEISYHTGNKIQFDLHVEFSTNLTYVQDSKIQTVSLGIPRDEPLEDAERDMDKLTRNSINFWED